MQKECVSTTSTLTLIPRVRKQKECVVPENIHTSSKDGFLVQTLPPHPMELAVLLHAFPLNFGFREPLSLQISSDHPWGGYEYLLEPHNEDSRYEIVALSRARH